MNTDYLKGSAKKAEGTVESTFGRATGDSATELKGEGNKLLGKAQTAFAEVEDKVYSFTGKTRELIHNASDSISSATTHVKDEIEHSPVRSSIIALGLGFILGSLLTR